MTVSSGAKMLTKFFDALEEKRYLKRHQAIMSALKIGAKDDGGYTINHIFSKGDEFIIYEAAELPPHESIRIYINTKKDDDLTLINNYNEVKKYMDKYKADCYKYKCGIEYKRRAATALAHGMNGKIEESKELFENIYKEIKNDHDEAVRAKLCYQAGALMPVLFLSISLLLVYILRDKDFFITNPLFLTLPVCFFWASLGGYLSVSLSIKNTAQEKSLKKKVYFYYGFERCLIALIAGVITYAVIKSGLVFDIFKKEDNKYILFILYLLSGFSETLIPNALKSIERKVE